MVVGPPADVEVRANAGRAFILAAVGVYGMCPHIVESIFQFGILSGVCVGQVAGVGNGGIEVGGAGNGILDGKIKGVVRRKYRNLCDL